MSKKDNTTEFFTEIADTIRLKTGKSDLINPQDFHDEILAIKTEPKIANTRTIINTTVNAKPKIDYTLSFKQYNGFHNDVPGGNLYIEHAAFEGYSIGTDGDNIYYSHNTQQYVLDKTTSTWSAKTGYGLTDFEGEYIGTDGTNIYYSNSHKSEPEQLRLNKATSTGEPDSSLPNILYGEYMGMDDNNIYFSPPNRFNLVRAKSGTDGDEMRGANDFKPDGLRIGTDGNAFYLSEGTQQYMLVANTNTGQKLENYWSGFTNIQGEGVWAANGNIYYSIGTNQYILDVATHTGNKKDWKYESPCNNTALRGYDIGTDGDNIYYSAGAYQYVLDKTTSTGQQMIWTKYLDMNNYSRNIWSDGKNIYYSDGPTQYVLEKSTATGLVMNGNGDYSNYISGENIFTDGTNIYHASGQGLILDKDTSTGVRKYNWRDSDSDMYFYGKDVWSDGENIYLNASMRFNKTELIGEPYSWSGSASAVVGRGIGTDGGNIYCSYLEIHLMLDKKNNAGVTKTWYGISADFTGDQIWSDGNKVYYSDSSGTYYLNKATSTGVLTYDTNFSGADVWSDGINSYVSTGISQYKICKNLSESMPKKGDIIKFKGFYGNGMPERKFKVLEIDGTIAKLLVMKMDDIIFNSCFYNRTSKVVSFSDGEYHQAYADSLLEYHASIYFDNVQVGSTEQIRAALVPVDRDQTCFLMEPGQIGSATFKMIGKNGITYAYNLQGHKALGMKYTFALDITDIIDYLDIEQNATVDYNDIIKMFSEDNNILTDNIGLASADARVQDHAFQINSELSMLSDAQCADTALLMTAFYIDLSQIDFYT